METRDSRETCGTTRSKAGTLVAAGDCGDKKDEKAPKKGRSSRYLIFNGDRIESIPFASNSCLSADCTTYVSSSQRELCTSRNDDLKTRRRRRRRRHRISSSRAISLATAEDQNHPRRSRRVWSLVGVQGAEMAEQLRIDLLREVRIIPELNKTEKQAMSTDDCNCALQESHHRRHMVGKQIPRLCL